MRREWSERPAQITYYPATRGETNVTTRAGACRTPWVRASIDFCFEPIFVDEMPWSLLAPTAHA